MTNKYIFGLFKLSQDEIFYSTSYSSGNQVDGLPLGCISKCRQLLDMYMLGNYDFSFGAIKMLLRTDITSSRALSTEEIYLVL